MVPVAKKKVIIFPIEIIVDALNKVIMVLDLKNEKKWLLSVSYH